MDQGQALFQAMHGLFGFAPTIPIHDQLRGTVNAPNTNPEIVNEVQIERLAKLFHNGFSKVACMSQGKQVGWTDLPGWRKQAIRHGVILILETVKGCSDG